MQKNDPMRSSRILHDSSRKVGLALGSGSARGLAHIGVLRAIKEAGIKVDMIAGTSMGAFIGAIFASGKLDDLESEFLNFNWKKIISLLDPVFPRSGLIDGQKVADFVRVHVHASDIEHLPIPFMAVATDIINGKEVVLESGDLIEAVRASISVPGIFTPVCSNGNILVDGALVNPLPVSVARTMGADLIIAVDLNHDIVTQRHVRPNSSAEENLYTQAMSRMLERLSSFESPALSQLNAWLQKETLPSVINMMLKSLDIMQERITQSILRHDKPDILIQPPLGAVRFMEFDRAEEIIEIGYRATAQTLASEQLFNRRR